MNTHNDKVKLARTSDGWAYRGLLITKHHWQVPANCVSYRLHFPNGKFFESDTLREMRSEIHEMETEGWEASIV